jgi:hypothetical protein
MDFITTAPSAMKTWLAWYFQWNMGMQRKVYHHEPQFGTLWMWVMSSARYNLYGMLMSSSTVALLLSNQKYFFLFSFFHKEVHKGPCKNCRRTRRYSRRVLVIVFNQQNTRLGKNLTVNVMPVHKDKGPKFPVRPHFYTQCL